MQTRPPYEHKWQKVYSHDRDPIREIIIYPLLINEIGSLEGEDIIDIGCGNGSLVSRFSSYKFNSAYCVDQSRYFLTQAKSIISDSRVHFIEADIINGLPFTDKSFNSIFSVFVLNELENIDHFFAESARLLKKGGTAHIITIHPFIVIYAHLYEKYLDKKNRKIIGNLDYKSKERLDYYFTLADAKSIFYQHTFESIITSISSHRLHADKLLELRTDNPLFEMYDEYWEERMMPKYLYLKLTKAL